MPTWSVAAVLESQSKMTTSPGSASEMETKYAFGWLRMWARVTSVLYENPPMASICPASSKHMLTNSMHHQIEVEGPASHACPVLRAQYLPASDPGSGSSGA